MGCCQKMKDVEEPKTGPPTILCVSTPRKVADPLSGEEEPTSHKPRRDRKHEKRASKDKVIFSLVHDISDYEADLSDEKSSEEEAADDRSLEKSPKKFQEKDKVLESVMKRR